MNNTYPFYICHNGCREKIVPIPGPAGPVGPQGAKGEKGDTGETGVGLEITGTVDTFDDLPKNASNGDAYFVGTQEPRTLCVFDETSGEWINQGTLKGEKGDTGEKGEQGVSVADIEISPTSSTEKGILYDMTVTLTDGTTVKAGDFLATKGEKGDAGAGLEITGTVDTVGDLPTTAQNGDAYLVGTTSPRTLYVYDATTSTWIEQGTLQGEKGDTGKSATITVGTVTTGDAGSSASVTNSGTENDAVFDFVIPKGDTFGIESLVSLNFQDVSETLTQVPIESALPIPSNNPPVTFDFTGPFTIREKGYYEITLSGNIIGGTSTDNGGSIQLQNVTAGTTLGNMKFNLDAGKDHQLQFSSTDIFLLDEDTVLRILTVSAGSDTDVTSFNGVCVVIKKLKLE